MRIFFLLICINISSPLTAQEIIKKEGLLFLANVKDVPSQGVFVEMVVDSTASAENNMSRLEPKRDTGRLLNIFYLYKKDKRYEELIADSAERSIILPS
jgi:hypothetical protein